MIGFISRFHIETMQKGREKRWRKALETYRQAQ